MAITTDIQQQVYDLLSRTSNLSFVNAVQEPGATISLTPGQRVMAEVLTTLPNNLVQVQVGSERFNLDLPMAVRQGQMLEMTFVSQDPRSTFAIARQGGLTQPVSLSDASRLLGLLVGNEQVADPKLRSSLQSIGEMLRRSSGEAGVLANLMDEALTYGGTLREAVKGPPQASGEFMQQYRERGTALQQGGPGLTPEQARLAAFESNAAQILQNIARSSRFILAEAVNQPVVPLPLMPGEEVDAAVQGTLPGGRVFVQVAGASLELVLPRSAQPGEILRLTYISSLPKPLFALQRSTGEVVPSSLSEAGRWLSVLEHNEGGPSGQQLYVLERLNSVLKSLPPDSPAFTVIQDEAITYQTLMRGRQSQTGGPVMPPAAQDLLQPENVISGDDMATVLQALVKENRLALLESPGQTGLVPGQQIKGEVAAALGGGRFLVQVGGQSMEFTLPKGITQGDSLNLFFISDEPHPAFLMPTGSRDGGGAPNQQMYTLEQLSTVLKSLPPESPLFAAVLEEADDLHAAGPARESQEQAGAAIIQARQATLQPGNGIVMNDDMAKLLQALIKGNRLALLEAINQQATPMGLSPGQQLKGEVISLLGGGRFMAQVAGHSLQFAMPKGTQRGDLVNLFFIADEPTPTFLMARFGQPGDSRVSETGRWLSGFLGATAERLPAQEAMGILRTLLAGPPVESSQVGKMLQQGLRESGLFYESHLARWFGGDYRLEDILREPQGRLSNLRLPAAAQTVAAATDEAARAGMKTGSMEVMEAMFRKAGTTLAHEGIADQRALPVVREQLDTLQSGQVFYRGELFSGQNMEWSVKEREARQNAASGQERIWDTTLRLDLPKLGAINARLALEGNRVSIDLRAGDAASAMLLDAGRPGLVEQLQSAGLNPTEIGIRHDAPRE